MARKIAPYAGMLGPLLFTLSFTIHGMLLPGYDPVRRYISELSIGRHGWIQIVSFIFLGVALLLFTPALKAAFPSGKASRSAPVIFRIIAVCYFLSGPFVTDEMAMFDNQQTLHGVLHGIFGAVVFSLSAVSCFVLWYRFRGDDGWKSLSAYTLTTGIAMAILIGLMKAGQLKAGLLNDWAGAVQRCCLILFYVWVFILAYRLRKPIRTGAGLPNLEI